jgi:hypothetical protein
MDDRLARLERALYRNAGNSLMPPSADDLPGKTAPQPRKSRGGGKRRQFRNAVRVGLSEVRRAPGAATKQKPGRLLLECLHKREADVLRFLHSEKCSSISGRKGLQCPYRPSSGPLLFADTPVSQYSPVKSQGYIEKCAMPLTDVDGALARLLLIY